MWNQINRACKLKKKKKNPVSFYFPLFFAGTKQKLLTRSRQLKLNLRNPYKETPTDTNNDGSGDRQTPEIWKTGQIQKLNANPSDLRETQFFPHIL